VAKGQPTQALDLLGDQKTPAAIQVRLDALGQLGDEAAIASLFDDLGMTKEYWNAVSHIQDWSSLAANGPDVWKAAAATLERPPEAAPAPSANTGPIPLEGPLARGQVLIDESASTREAINALLNSVKSPAAPSQ
jgi:hypothetical protein